MSGQRAGERLQKLLAGAGHGSRRQIEQWIRDGRVTVDGRLAELGARAGEGADIRLDGQPLRVAAAAAAREVLIYYKPAGEVTTRSDPQGRPTVFDHLPAPCSGRWVTVGRLDVNTTGLLLFTNDGALAHRLMHPSSQIEREYRVRVRGNPPAAVLARLLAGIALEDGLGRFESIEPDSMGGPADSVSTHRWFRVVLREGRNREVRRLWQAAGYEVSRLTRLRYGSVNLPADLRIGRWRRLDPAQASAL